MNNYHQENELRRVTKNIELLSLRIAPNCRRLDFINILCPQSSIDCIEPKPVISEIVYRVYN